MLLAVEKKVGSAQIKPGVWSHGQLKVARYPDGRNAYIPISIAAGNNIYAHKKIKCVVIVGGAHGDEPNGTELVGRVVPAIDPNKLRGLVILLPIMNPWGFYGRQRHVPIDNRDLNRSYPGHKQGSFTFQVAHSIFNQIIEKADLVIDAHDAGKQTSQIVNPRVHIEPKDDPTQLLGRLYGADLVLYREAETGMLAREARDCFGTKVVSVELAGEMRIDEKAQQKALRGILNLLRHQGLLAGKLILPKRQSIYKDQLMISAQEIGIQTNYVAVGNQVTKGQLLYKIYNPIARTTFKYRAESAGLILILNTANVSKGDIATIILKKDGQRNIINQADKSITILKSKNVCRDECL